MLQATYNGEYGCQYCNRDYVPKTNGRLWELEFCSSDCHDDHLERLYEYNLGVKANGGYQDDDVWD